jgi:hypothetical protein
MIGSGCPLTAQIDIPKKGGNIIAKRR